MIRLSDSLKILLCGLLLTACGAEQGADEPGRDQRPRPVPLVLIDGRPDPSVLADEQILHRNNGEEPQTLDPHLAEGVPSSHILRDLFEGLVAEHGSLDAVVNVAGISRPTSFATGFGADWTAVLQVHLEGYLTVLRAALPLMATAGKVTIAQADRLVPLGEIDPECVVTPGIFVHRVVEVRDPAQESDLVARGVSYP